MEKQDLCKYMLADDQNFITSIYPLYCVLNT